MDKKELLKRWYSELTATELKLKMISFLIRNGARVNQRELDALLDRYRWIKKLIEEFEKD